MRDLVVYVHTGVWVSNSPSCTFVTYNAIAMANEFTKVYLFIKKGSKKNPKTVLKESFNLDKPDNLRIIAIPYKLLRTNFFYYIIVALKLLTCSTGIKCIISRNATFLPFLCIFKDFFHIPVFFESHDFYSDLTLRDDKHKRVSIRNNKLEMRYIPKLTGLICLQNVQKELYRKYFADLPIHVLRTGLHKVSSAENTKRKYLCYIGSFDAHKGVESLFEAVSQSKSNPIVLLIGGKEDNDIIKIKALAGKYNYEDKIIVTGWINKQRLEEYLSEVKVGIVSLEKTFFNSYITSPLKLFDYFSFGIPVIATDLPTTRELVDEYKTGLFFQANEIAEFTDNIDKLFTNQELYQDMVSHVYHKANSMKWESRAKQLHEILDEKQ